jgi:hypothetical protein
LKGQRRKGKDQRLKEKGASFKAQGSRRKIQGAGLKGEEAGKLEGWKDKKVRELKAEKAESSRLKVNTTDNNPQHATNNAQQTQRSQRDEKLSRLTC